MLQICLLQQKYKRHASIEERVGDETSESPFFLWFVFEQIVSSIHIVYIFLKKQLQVYTMGLQME